MEATVGVIRSGWAAGLRALIGVVGRGPHQGTVLWREACAAGDVTLMQVLLEAGVKYFRVSPGDKRTLAHYAGSEHVLRFFADARMDVGDPAARDAKGCTAAHVLAASEGVNADALRTLEEYGADLEALDDEGLAPIHHA